MFQFRRIAAAAALVGAMPFASAAVLTFDDLSGSSFFTSNYQGFQFGTNSAATNAFFYTNDTSTYPALSGSTFVAVDFSLYNNANFYQGTTAASLAGAQQLITSATPFVFNGASFAGSGRAGETIGYRLYVGNSVVFTTATPVALSLTYTQVDSGYSGLVTGVEIFGHQGYYAMDNFTYNVTAVPEPGTYALMVAGLAAVGGVAARRRRSV